MAGWIGAAVLVLVALALFGWALSAWLAFRAMRRWPVVQGKVAITGLDSERRLHRHAARLVHLPTVAYRYEAGGEKHIGSRLANRTVLFEREEEARRFLDALPTGAPVDVRYNPANANEAVLEVRAPALASRIAGGVLCLGGAAALLFA
ncbi:DUF3592 domain-containing protein [Zavarzinia compransoris]|uniref:DUF3592 domain-containing protein n=1 Tax=Zavarzinia marina TaxID=2911065 RepID=UPI001F421CBA|nr:DUF3592 domain-containing protein [Zavarzinia marina]MCF4166160.1 DUF3592 domain-containing protein [Zavarzinia marina]